ncbi:MAG: hypothetical protein M1840_003747, partial [Geoglossum simile]
LLRLYDLIVDLIWDDSFESSRGMKYLDGMITTVREMRGKPVSIWIDTFCVPLEKETRKLAIATLPKVYGGAAKTVVLDSELQRLSGRNSPAENLMCVAFSGWMRRAWTFQEAALADNRLKILFSDGLVDLAATLGQNFTVIALAGFGLSTFPSAGRIAQSFFSAQSNLLIEVARRMGGLDQESLDIMRQTMESSGRMLTETSDTDKTFSIPTDILQSAQSFFLGMVTAWSLPLFTSKGGAQQAGRMSASWNALRWRSTSKEEDKLIIFATAWSMTPADFASVQQLLSVPKENRMRKWIESQECLPLGLLFVDGPHMQEKGLRWAPTAIHMTELQDSTAVPRSVSDKRLKVKKPGFLLFPGETLSGGDFIITDIENLLCYKVTLSPIEASSIGNSSSGPLGLILLKTMTQFFVEVGVLIHVTDQREDLIHGIFAFQVGVEFVSGSSAAE